MKAVFDIQELIRVIGANSSDSSSAKSIVVEIKTRDNKIVRGIVRGFNYKGSKRPEVISIKVPRIDANLLRSHVKNLLEKGKSFIVRNGPANVCLFEWTIEEL